MELKEYLHMNDGNGVLSYSQNSFVQEEAWLMNQKLLDSAIQSVLSNDEQRLAEAEALNIADLGCGAGPVPSAFVTLVMDSVQKKCKELLKWDSEAHQVPTLQIFMNDLPSNDFNLLFRDLLNLKVLRTNEDGEPSCFLRSVPGSYYHRLFPGNTLHFVHATYTLHWFSQLPAVLSGEKGVVPINKGNYYISETSNKDVAKAYLAQFEQDFTQFLNCRSQEVVPKGRMLLSSRGRPSRSDSYTWQPWELQIFSKALNCLKKQGLMEEEKLDSFNFPYYCASKEELESIVEKQGSFAVETTKTVAHHVAHEIEDMGKRSTIIANFIRAFSESLITHHFGEDIVDLIYDRLAYYAFQHLDLGHLAQHHTVTILLRKI